MTEKDQSRVSLWPSICLGFLLLICMIALLIRFPYRFDARKEPIPESFSHALTVQQQVLQEGLNPYVSAKAQPRTEPVFNYSPAFLVLLQIVPSSVEPAWKVFTALTIILLALVIGFGVRIQTWQDLGWMTFGVALSWRGILDCIQFGQVEFWLLFLSVVSAFFLRRLPFLSGLILGVIPWIRFSWIGLFIPFLALVTKKSNRSLGSFVGGLFAASFIWGVVIPSLAFGPDRAMELAQGWVQSVAQRPESYYFTDYNQSLWTLMTRWLQFGSHSWTMGVAFLVGGVLLGMMLSRPQDSVQRHSPLTWLSPWFLICTLINPLAWKWASLFLLGIPHATRQGNLVRNTFYRKILWGSALVFWAVQHTLFAKLLGYSSGIEALSYGMATFQWLCLLLLCV